MENKNIKILVIDDNMDNLISMKALVRETFPQATVFSALNGIIGIELAASENPDVILLDILMPEMDGFEVCEKLKADKKLCGIPVVFITAMKKDKDSHIRALEVGGEAFLAKPIDVSELIAQINAMVKIKRANIQELNEKERLAALVKEQTAELKKNYTAMLNLLEDLREENDARKLSEAALQKSESLFRTIFNDAPMGIALGDSHTGRICEMNPRFAEITGRTVEEMKNIDWMSITHPDDLNKDLEQMAKMNAGEIDGFKMNKRYIKPDGSYVWISITIARLQDTELTGKQHLAMIDDITELIRTEQALLANEEFLEETQRIANIGTYTLDIATGKWTSSEILDLIFGIDASFNRDVANWEKMVHPECRKIMSDYFAQDVVAGKKKFNKEYKIIRHNDQAERWVHGLGRLKFDKNGKPVAMVGTICDITERRKIEDDLIKSKERAEESDKLKTAFLNNLSHEIRTPFNGMLGFLSMLQDDNLSSSERDEYISAINKSAERLMNTINDTIEIAKIQTKQIKYSESEIDLNRMVSELSERFKHHAEIKGLDFIIKNTIPADGCKIKTDGNKLITVINSLINNALKFTHAGSIQLDIRTNSEGLEFAVKDTGVGIPPDKRQSIFERFMQADVSHTRKFEGSGLGLSIAKAYVELLGGNIQLASNVGEGSIFYFTIPYQIANPEKVAPTPAKPAATAQPSLKILIAEDDELNFSYFSTIFTRTGSGVLHAWNGAEAVELCREHSDIGIIFMDIKMPVMDGYTATGEIRKFKPDVPIVAITAYAAMDDKKKCLASGMDDYVSKPVRPQALLEVLNKWLPQSKD